MRQVIREGVDIETGMPYVHFEEEVIEPSQELQLLINYVRQRRGRVERRISGCWTCKESKREKANWLSKEVLNDLQRYQAIDWSGGGSRS